MFSKKKLLHIFSFCLVFFNLFFSFQNKLLAQNSSAYNDVRVSPGKDSYCADYAMATSNGKNRNSGCFSSEYDYEKEECKKPKFIFDPFGNNPDLDWNYGNDYCLGYLLGAGITMEAAFIGCRVLCPGPPASIGKKAFEKLTQGPKMRKLAKVANVAKQASGASNLIAQGVMGGMPLDPFTVIELGIFFARCVGILESTNCCTALAICGSASSVAIGIVGGIYKTAEQVFNDVHICGRGWKSFLKANQNPSTDPNQYKTVNGNYKNCLNMVFGGETFGTAPTQDCSNTHTRSQKQFCDFMGASSGVSTCQLPADPPANPTPDPTPKKRKALKIIHYREFLFKGIEYDDNGPDACENPKGNEWEALLGYSGGKQRYYFRGPRELPNFACKRFLQLGRKNVEGMKAFICCNEKSQNTICLETDKKFEFCRIGGECTTRFEKTGVVMTQYKIFESERNPNYICAKTYSSCPYDHNVQGGTDYDERFALNPKVISNYCQYMNHCVKRPPIAKYTNFDPDSFFFAESCEDLKGDSQFMTKSAAAKPNEFTPSASRHFSAPLVQCFKETLENNFIQKVGRTVCTDLTEQPKKSPDYPNGFCKSGYSYKKGDIMNQTFFNKIQNQFRFPLKIAFVLSMVFFGFNILLATPESYINKKTVMTYLVKFGLVYFFVLGNAWQGFFMDSIMNISSEISNITFQPNKKDDGCNFPKYDYKLLNDPDKEDKTNEDKIEDFMKDIVKTPSYPLGKNYLRIFDTLDCKVARAIGYGPEVSTPNLAKMIFSGLLTGGLGITFFVAAFTYGFMLISIAMRAVHITIISVMGIILLIYVSPITITCALFERTKGIFENWWKQMLGFILQPMIVFAYIGLMLTVFDNLFIGDARFESNPNNDQLLPKLSCEKEPNSFINPEETSVYCILNFAKFKNFSGLEVFDLALPILGNLNSTKINTLFRAAIVMFVFFKFFDKITSVAKKLVGGADLNSESGLSEIKNQIQKVARGVQKRAANTVMRGATKQIPNAVKDKIRGTGEKDTPPEPKSSGGQAGDTGGGGSGGESGGGSGGESGGTGGTETGGDK